MIAIDDVFVSEGDGEAVTAIFEVSLSQGSGETVEVDFTTAPETAEPGLDYETVSGTLTFDPGETAQFIQVPIVGDRTLEPEEETFRIELSSAVNAGFDDDRGVGTILDDELCKGPNLVVNPSAETWPSGSGIPGWKQRKGGPWKLGSAPPEPVDGLYFFAPGTAATTANLPQRYLDGDDIPSLGHQKLADQDRAETFHRVTHRAGFHRGRCRGIPFLYRKVFCRREEEGRQSPLR